MVCHLNQHNHAIQTYYPDTKPTNTCPILVMMSTWLRTTSINFKDIGLIRPGIKAMGSSLKPAVIGTGGGRSTHSVTPIGIHVLYK